MGRLGITDSLRERARVRNAERAEKAHLKEIEDNKTIFDRIGDTLDSTADTITNAWNDSFITIILFCLSIFAFLAYRIHKKYVNKAVEKALNEAGDSVNQRININLSNERLKLVDDLKNLQLKHAEITADIDEQRTLITDFINAKIADYPVVATVIADYKTAKDEALAQHLRTKKTPCLQGFR